MFFSSNKHVFLGAVVAAAVWLAVYGLVVRDNWATAAARLDESEKVRATWEKYYDSGKNLLPKVEAEKALNENKAVLSKNLTNLQKIELGTRETLHKYTEAAAGAGDKKSYFDQERIKIANNVNDILHIPTPPGLGILGERAADDPVGVNLVRLAMVDAFIAACQKAGIAKIVRIQHLPPKVIETGNEDEAPADAPAEEPKDTKDTKDAKAKAPKTDAGPRRLVQFPMKMVLQLEEEQFGKLLFELAKPTEGSHRYLCLRGFHVAVRDSGSGMIEAGVAVSALLNENLARTEMGVQLKEQKGPAHKVDLNGW